MKFSREKEIEGEGKRGGRGGEEVDSTNRNTKNINK